MWNAISLVQDLDSCRRVISYDDNHYTTGTFNWYHRQIRIPYFSVLLQGLNIHLSFRFLKFYSMVCWDNHYYYLKTYSCV